LIGGNVTLSFKAKVSSTTKLDNVKAAIVAWSGTSDTVTSDIISAWNVEGTNPTLIANATFENSPTNLNVTTSYATYTVTGNVDTASTKNIIVFIWSDVTDTTLGDFLFITDVQLEFGNTATPFERRSFGQELALCQRYFELTGDMYYRSYNPSGNAFRMFTPFKVSKRTASATVTVRTVGGNEFTGGTAGSVSISGSSFGVTSIDTTSWSYTWETTSHPGTTATHDVGYKLVISDEL